MATREDYNANKHRTSHTRHVGNVGLGNVGLGNVGAGTSAPAPAPPAPPAPPASSGPIVSDDRDAEDKIGIGVTH